MKKGIFLDRDGVINRLVHNPDTQEFEPPHTPEDIILYPEVIQSLKRLQDAGFLLFIVSNQPDYAKGKTTFIQLKMVHEEMNNIFRSNGIYFKEYYYCYHHPNGNIAEFSISCDCRKPKPYFILKAAQQYNINLNNSWMIGDRDTDIECGRKAGVRTILIDEPHSAPYRGHSTPEFSVKNLKNAADLIIALELHK